MQIESVAHCGAASLIQSGGTTSHRVYSSPNIGTPLLESATHSGSDLRPYCGAQPETQNEQSDLPSYQEVMRGKFVELTPGEYALADLRGGREGRTSPPLGVQILSISCSFLGEFGKITPPFRVHAPTWGKSWIRH